MKNTGQKFLGFNKYPNWSQELKNIYDDLPELHVVFTGSSLLEILNAKSDLRRRAIVYEMQGFSFREYLNWNEKLSLPILTLNNILDNHLALSVGIVDKVKVLKHFSDYLKHGYYPYYNELPALYYYGYQYNGKGRRQIYSLFKISESAHNDKQE